MYVYCIYSLSKQVDGGVDFKDVHIVPPIKTTDLVPSLTKAQFQLVSKLPLKKRVVTVWGAGKLY